MEFPQPDGRVRQIKDHAGIVQQAEGKAKPVDWETEKQPAAPSVNRQTPSDRAIPLWPRAAGWRDERPREQEIVIT